VTLADTLRTFAEHAEKHARQLQTVRDGYKGYKARKTGA
jgi:hypothetical protein